MAQLSERVRRDPFTDNAEVFLTKRGCYCADLVTGKWRVYEYHEDYSTTSGGFCIKGHAQRFWSGPYEGQIAQFSTKQEAITWLQGLEGKS